MSDSPDSQEIPDLFARGGEVPLPDPREPSDPVLTEMVRLSSLPPRARDEALEPYLEKWLLDNTEALSVARYLAAAGLTLEEAAALDRIVRERLTGELRRIARQQIRIGLGAIGAGFLLLAGAKIANLAFPLWGVFCVAAVVLGVGSLTRGLRLLRRITPAPDE